LKQKGNFPTPFPYFLSPEDFRDAFCVTGGAFGRPWLRWIRRLTRHTKILKLRGFTSWRHDQGVPSGVQGQSPGRGPGRRSPPEAEAKCEISVQLLTFSCTKFRI